MGQETSIQASRMTKSKSVPLMYKKINKTNDFIDDSDEVMSSLMNSPNKINVDSLHGVWKRTVIDCGASANIQYPQPRVGHFTCNDDRFIYIGLGTNVLNEFDDVWRYDMIEQEWIKLDCKLEPRNGARACLYENYIIIFGGFSNKRYYNDIRVIKILENDKSSRENSILKCDVSILETKGDKPQPRSTPVIACYNKKLFIWGGYNGNYPSDLSVLDFSSFTWKTIPQPSIKGRTGMAWTTSFHNNKKYLYIYGGCEKLDNELLMIDLETEEMSKCQTFKGKGEKGAFPQSKWMGAGMVYVNIHQKHFLVLFGGKSPKPSTDVYILNIETMEWNTLNVVPDGISTRINDGYISDNGSFQLPAFHSFSVAYDSKKERILAFLGQPISNFFTMNELSLDRSF